jgi:hypothetical protein
LQVNEAIRGLNRGCGLEDLFLREVKDIAARFTVDQVGQAGHRVGAARVAERWRTRDHEALVGVALADWWAAASGGVISAARRVEAEGVERERLFVVVFVEDVFICFLVEHGIAIFGDEQRWAEGKVGGCSCWALRRWAIRPWWWERAGWCGGPSYTGQRRGLGWVGWAERRHRGLKSGQVVCRYLLWRRGLVAIMIALSNGASTTGGNVFGVLGIFDWNAIPLEVAVGFSRVFITVIDVILPASIEALSFIWYAFREPRSEGDIIVRLTHQGWQHDLALTKAFLWLRIFRTRISGLYFSGWPRPALGDGLGAREWHRMTETRASRWWPRRTGGCSLFIIVLLRYIRQLWSRDTEGRWL